MTPKHVGWAGVALAVLAFFVAVPPIMLRSPVVVVVLGLAAIGAGSYAYARGHRRLGGGAIAGACFGIAGGVASTLSGEANLERVVVWGALLAATLRYATPLLFGALGGLFSERAGVINIALEGMMLIGAFFGALGADKTGSWVLGIVIAIVAGAIFAAIHALFAVSLRADQIVSGTALNLLALGITGYLYVDIYGTDGTPDDLPQVPDITLPIDVDPVLRRRLRPAQPARLDRADRWSR